MRIGRASPAVSLGMSLAPGAVKAADIRVDLSSQTMRVTSDGGERFVWPVSTARQGFRTPRGTYGVQRMAEMHFSRKYNNSPMPHSIFFKGGYAIHGSYETAALGRAASHGCIRLSPWNAAELYRLVEAEGARITISGRPPYDMAASGRRRPLRGLDGSPPAEPFGAAPLVGMRLAPSFDDSAPGSDQDSDQDLE